MSEEPIRQKVVSPEALRKRLVDLAEKAGTPAPISRGLKGALVGRLNAALEGPVGTNVDTRHLLLGYLFTPAERILRPLSSSTLTDGQWLALLDWVGAVPVEGEWLARWAFPVEALWALERARQLYGVSLGLLMGRGLPSLKKLLEILPYNPPGVVDVPTAYSPPKAILALLKEFPLPDGTASVQAYLLHSLGF